MKEKQALRQLNISLHQDEYDKFVKAYKNTIHRSKSSYARKLILGKPVTVVYRNRSLDDFIESAVKIRKDLKLLLSKETFTVAEKEELKRKFTIIETNLIKIVDLCSQK